MENREKGNNKPAIDEDYLMSIMAGEEKQGKQPQPGEPTEEAPTAKPLPKERNRTKRGGDVDYEQIFFKNPETAARNGKSVYIRPEFHDRLSRIVQVIGEDKLTIYAYLNNVLEYHFEEFADQIKKCYNEKYKPIL